MNRIRARVPIALPISIVVLLILGAVSSPLIKAYATPEQLSRNILLGGIPFILIFVAIVLAFITIITVAASLLNNNIAARSHRRIENFLIAGIVLGVVGMFQPWLFAAYRYGFVLLLLSTLMFILWSHITPKRLQRREEYTTASVADIGSRELESQSGDQIV